ncbi:MAG TPA: FKBP-type peptidyl-prolyl cis-trans isomerase [Candidatus Saccharimonadales bacterium]|nr:FKBP-type peptidyl-prolyl cis-trans isomerase [Candidatus Saccharimonadales bacterium]
MRINKTEIIIGSGVLVAALMIVGGGLWWHAAHSRHTKQLSDNSSNASTTDNPNIALGQDSAGLNVSGQASELGQLGNNSGGQSQGGQGSNNNAGNSNSGINPASFSQYDKYQSSKDALFGDIQKGTGPQLTAGHGASIYYKVWLTNGALVDQSPLSSSGQPQPYSFTLGGHQVIPGLEEGVYGMKMGGQRLIIVPPAVGYGSKGQGSVPPGAVMVFQVQLVNVK